MGIAESIIKKSEAAGCPISAASPSASALAVMDKKRQCHRKRAKGKHYKKRRAQCPAERFRTYYAKYKPGQLLEIQSQTP